MQLDNYIKLFKTFFKIYSIENMKKFLCILIICFKIFDVSAGGHDESSSSKRNKGKGPMENLVELSSSSDDSDPHDGIPNYLFEVVAPEDHENWKKAFAEIQQNSRKNSSTHRPQNPNTSQHLGVEPIRMKNVSKEEILISERPMVMKRTIHFGKRRNYIMHTDTENFRNLVNQVTGKNADSEIQQQMGINPSMHSEFVPPTFDSSQLDAQLQKHQPISKIHTQSAQFNGNQQIFKSSNEIHPQIPSNPHSPIAAIPLRQRFPFALNAQQQQQLAILKQKHADQIPLRQDIKTMLEWLKTIEANSMKLRIEDRELELKIENISAKLFPFEGENGLELEKEDQLQREMGELTESRLGLAKQIAKLDQERTQIKQKIFAKMPSSSPPTKE